MCFGGRQQAAAPATIIMPETRGYDSRLEDQMRAMREQMDNQQKLLQDQLQSSLARNADMMDRIVQSKTDQANSAEAIDRAVAERFDILRGPVADLVPEPAAVQPQQIVSSGQIAPGAREKGASRESDVNRGGAKKAGKGGLRIARSAPKKSSKSFGQGAGLNIT